MHASANIPLIWSSGNEHFSQFSTMQRIRVVSRRSCFGAEWVRVGWFRPGCIKCNEVMWSSICFVYLLCKAKADPGSVNIQCLQYVFYSLLSSCKSVALLSQKHQKLNVLSAGYSPFSFFFFKYIFKCTVINFWSLNPNAISIYINLIRIIIRIIRICKHSKHRDQ